MPSIADIFGGDPETESPEFDLDKFLADADSIIKDRSAEPPELAPEADPVAAEGAPTPPGDSPGAQSPSSGGEPEGPGAGAPPPVVVSTPAPDPLSEIPAERRAQLLALDEYMREHPDALSRITAPEAKPEPEPIKLPEHIDPGSIEAELWMGQQEQGRLLQEIAAGYRQTQESLATDRLRVTTQEAAMAAGNAFAARYEGKLTIDDVLSIAQIAGAQGGIAGRLASQAKSPEEITAAYDEALEHVLWKTPEFRAKADGPIVGVPDVPTAKEADRAAAPDRKRKLTALSGAASPVAGAPASRSPLETRADGRLTGQSRMDLVKSLASQLAWQQ